MGQFNSLRNDSNGLISEEQRNLRTNRLLASTNSLMKDLEQEIPEKFQADLGSGSSQPGGQNASPSSPESKSNTIIVHGNVGSIASDVKGDFIQNIDQRTVNY